MAPMVLQKKAKLAQKRKAGKIPAPRFTLWVPALVAIAISAMFLAALAIVQ